MGHILQLVDQYGYIILFAALTLELIAFPIPTELLMSYVGYLAYEGKLNLYLSLLFAALGTSLGMSISYWIGYGLGFPFFRKYGHRFHMGEERLEKISNLFSTYGVRLLLISCFIPGVRHLTGYFSGITKSRFRRFATFSYAGAFIWVTTFIGLGWALGPQYKLIEESIKRYLIIGGLSLSALIICYILIKYNWERLKAHFLFWLETFSSGFHSERRLFLLILAVAIAFIGLVILLAGLIQDLLSHDFDDFNRVASFLVQALFDKNWSIVMSQFLGLSSWGLLFSVMGLTVLWLYFAKSWSIDLWFYLCLLVGGYLFSEVAHFIIFHTALYFHLPIQAATSFPNLSLVFMIIVYGFFAFSFSRHSHLHWVKPFLWFVVLATLGCVTLSEIYFSLMLASEIVVGYCFGAVVLTFSLLLLEIRRLMEVL